jgi:alkylation response protein AidB-like acyl-CoA dehydrogenase
MSYRPPTEEQLALRATLRAFFAERWPETEVRQAAASETGHDPTLWRSMADDLGLHGLAIAESLGGGGFGFVDLLVVFEEMGRALVGGPFFASVGLAAPLLAALGPDPRRDDLLAGIASGTRIATVAVSEQPTRWDARGIATTAIGSGTDRTVSGTKLFVLDGLLADVLLVVAVVNEGIGVLVVDPDAPGVRVESMQTIDATRRQARVFLDRTPARMLCPGHDAAGAVASMCQHGAVALAAEQVGGSQRVLEMAVAYAKVREQFGRTIGGFQAIKHQLSDLLVSVEAGRAALAHAVAAWQGDPDQRARAASVAKAFCSDVFVDAADRNIHVHGGIGFTWEHPAHLFYKRAVSGEVMLGAPREHREMIAAGLLEPREGR